MSGTVETAPGRPGAQPEATRGPKTARGPKAARGRWSEMVLICGKCGKRQGLGRGEMRKRLKRAAKAQAGLVEKGSGKAGLRLKVVEVGCLGICPGKGVLAATGADLSRGRMLVLAPDVAGEAALRALLAAPLAAPSPTSGDAP